MATRFNYSDFVWNLYSIMAERRDLFMWDGAESTAAAVAAAAVQHSNHNMSASAGQNSSRNGIPEWLSSRPVTSEPSGLSSGRGINANTDWRGIPSRNNHHEPTTPTSTASSSSPVSYHQSAVKQNVIQGFGGPSIGGRSAGELSSQCQPSTPNSFSPPASALTNNNNQLVVPQPLKPATKTKRSYQCKMCDQMFESKSDLLVHSHQVHKQDPKPYKCVTCAKCFANSSYLSQHARIHSGIKPYQCNFCERRFTQLSHLQQHRRTHTGEKPYRCQHPGCGKAFTQLSNLQTHSRSHMTDKPYRCNSCYKCFADEQGLRDHIPKHAETKHLKTHICHICGKSYTQETYLSRHMSKHNMDGNVPRIRIPKAEMLPSPTSPDLMSPLRSPLIKQEPGTYDDSCCNTPKPMMIDNMNGKPNSAFMPISSHPMSQANMVNNGLPPTSFPFTPPSLPQSSPIGPSLPHISCVTSPRYFPYDPVNSQRQQESIERDFHQRDFHQPSRDKMIANSLLSLQHIKNYSSFTQCNGTGNTV
ncbi:uncharacterized protein LOC141908629 isoform X4 [Tubulanus polymorphus]|uniref:uncharacterized protein LOC141908629 isoform X4 n=1 Tax=Tubulanus polymorphus TaxID=672921 RepID=UPI003DA57E1C